MQTENKYTDEQSSKDGRRRIQLTVIPHRKEERPPEKDFKNRATRGGGSWGQSGNSRVMLEEEQRTEQNRSRGEQRSSLSNQWLTIPR